MARAVVAIAFVSAVLGLFQVAGAGSELHLYRITSDDAPVGLLANRNHQAALLSLAVALTGALAGLRRQDVGDPRVGLGAALALAAVLILGALSTGSRMGLLLCALGIVGGLCAYKAAGRRLSPKRPLMKLVFAGVAVAVLVCVGLAAVRGGAVERLAHSDRIGDTIAWVNRDTVLHSVTARDHSFDLRINPGHTVKQSLTKAGSFPFLCLFHTTMRGTLAVGGK